MASNLVGLVGWRGMVGSVLLQRMAEEGDFALIEPLFFSTSNAGGAAPAPARNETLLQSADDIAALKRCDVIVTCQGGEYTKLVYPQLRAAGWKGYWIDAAKTLRDGFRTADIYTAGTKRVSTAEMASAVAERL